jgi:4'-phosphopantetheinyl transferase
VSGSAPVSLPDLGAVDVWWIDLDRIEDDSPSLLAHDERVRVERFRSPPDRARWIGARVALRQILTRYTGTMPALLQLTHGTNGKPALTGESSLRFNLAHAGDRAALAVAWDREVGVDLEPIGPCLDVLPLLAIACSETEAARIAVLSPGARVEAFLTCWTLKESYLKGIGTGLSRDPRTVEIALLPDDRAVVTDHLVGTKEPLWSVRLLRPGSGWVAAVAAHGHWVSIAEYHWPPPLEVAGTGG